MRRSHQEMKHAQSLGVSQVGKTKILELIQFETMLDRAKMAHQKSLLILKDFLTEHKSSKLDVDMLSGKT